MARRSWFCVILLAAALHVVGIARTPLPAQDGLKFIATARRFQTEPALDVIRGTDRHPLYPALVALVEPLFASVLGHGPDSWRIAAQGVSAIASLLLLVPLYGLARALFDERTAALTALLSVLLPLPAEIGHDTLSDSLALLAILGSMRLGELALRTERGGAAVACGVVAGLGFLARPEVLVAPLAVGVAGLVRPQLVLPRVAQWRLFGVALSFLVVVGTYALAKGEFSEKLALRRAVPVAASVRAPKAAVKRLPPGLDDPRWDFSAKEESNAPAPASLATAVARVLVRWAEGMAWFLAPLAILGAFRARTSESGRWAKRLLVAYLALFSAVLLRHTMTLGYLSDRHVLSLVLVSLPWAAAGALACGRRLADGRQWTASRRRGWACAVLAIAIGTGAAVQGKPGHPSRWGHQAAGRWLIKHAAPGDAVLDTRGWAAFVSGLPSYDYWHVGQALSDARLSYVVVGSDELAAASRRAATLKAVLAFAGTRVATFPERSDGRGSAVCVYRFLSPDSWEGLHP